MTDNAVKIIQDCYRVAKERYHSVDEAMDRARELGLDEVTVERRTVVGRFVDYSVFQIKAGGNGND